jgi:ADP-ribose pyrophosphatase
VSVPGFEIRKTLERFHGAVFDLVTDEVAMPDGTTAERDYIRHGGAVAVVAIDDEARVVLVRQYRHATREVLWELPAGLLDVPGEDPAAAAARELAEEAKLAAARWEQLVAVYTSPGFSNELIRIFLARELSPAAPDEAFEAQYEEAGMTAHELPLAEAVRMVERGEITNGPTALGLLAAWNRLRTS